MNTPDLEKISPLSHKTLRFLALGRDSQLLALKLSTLSSPRLSGNFPPVLHVK
jgi:hypothetical protein